MFVLLHLNIIISIEKTEEKRPFFAKEHMLEQLTQRMAMQEGITESLKAADQIEWIRRMNSIRSRAEEIVRDQIINTL